MKRFLVLCLLMTILSGGASISAAEDQVWYVPGFQIKNGNFDSVQKQLEQIFPNATVEIWHWDPPRSGDITKFFEDWESAKAKSNEAVNSLSERIQDLAVSKRRNLTIVGYSLGARIAIKAIAQSGCRINHFVVLGAAINNDDPSIETALNACREQSLSIVNMQDGALGAYRASENHAAMGAGYAKIVDRDVLCELAYQGGPVGHDANGFLDCLNKAVSSGNYFSSEPIVFQDQPNVRCATMDGQVFWKVLDDASGWQLQYNMPNMHCRILAPDKQRWAWGDQDLMEASFAKLKAQLEEQAESGNKQPLPEDWYLQIKVKYSEGNLGMPTAGGEVWWTKLDEYEGWVLQSHKITGHCRILDPRNYRRAYGDTAKMRESFNDLRNQIDALFEKYEKP